MNVLKIEKNFCGACLEVGAFLDDSGVAYTSLNIQGEDEEAADTAREYLAQLQLFTVPVTVLVDGEGNIIEHARGMDVTALESLIKMVK